MAQLCIIQAEAAKGTRANSSGAPECQPLSPLQDPRVRTMQPSTEQPQPDAIAARNRRSLAIALALIAFVVIVFTVTLVRLQGAVLNRPF